MHNDGVFLKPGKPGLIKAEHLCIRLAKEMQKRFGARAVFVVTLRRPCPRLVKVVTTQAFRIPLNKVAGPTAITMPSLVIAQMLDLATRLYGMSPRMRFSAPATADFS